MATIIMTCILYLSHEHFKDELISLYLFSAIAIICFAYFIVLGIMKRGIELLDHLKTTMNAQQELLIKNALMDRASKMDALTDCYNHKTFHEYLDNLIEQSESKHFPLTLPSLTLIISKP
jgi:preprotein translocase subunit SecF